jgi:hypothetical protein
MHVSFKKRRPSEFGVSIFIWSMVRTLLLKGTAGIVNTGGKLATGINNTSGTGGKFFHRGR